jgi:hypothetical protein
MFARASSSMRCVAPPSEGVHFAHRSPAGASHARAPLALQRFRISAGNALVGRVGAGTFADHRHARNIIGMVSGEPGMMAVWKAAVPARIIVGSDLRISDTSNPHVKIRSPDELRQLRARGLLDVLGEVMAQYEGIAPDDVRLEPQPLAAISGSAHGDHHVLMRHRA